jgi:SAM-dependent methyltransferase
VVVGERWAFDASRRALLSLLRGDRIRSVLIPGCYLGAEDVQLRLWRGVDRREGIDAYSLARRWLPIVGSLREHYGGEIAFRQASVERIPFEDGVFDLVASAAVLEHVRNLRGAVAEMARVLRPGGWAWHEFGPLYHCYGGDHCIAAYGSDHGYDHLLLDDVDYRRLVDDQTFSMATGIRTCLSGRAGISSRSQGPRSTCACSRSGSRWSTWW